MRLDIKSSKKQDRYSLESEDILRRATAGLSSDTLSSAGFEIGSSLEKCTMTKVSHLKYGYFRPALLPYVDMSRLKATRTPMILPMKPTSRNAKLIICGTRFRVLVFFAFSGMNNVVSARCAIPKSPASLGGACIIACPA